MVTDRVHPALRSFFRVLRTSNSTSFISLVVFANAGNIPLAALLNAA